MLLSVGVVCRAYKFFKYSSQLQIVKFLKVRMNIFLGMHADPAGNCNL